MDEKINIDKPKENDNENKNIESDNESSEDENLSNAELLDLRDKLLVACRSLLYKFRSSVSPLRPLISGYNVPYWALSKYTTIEPVNIFVATCRICYRHFKLNEICRKLACSHRFHPSCIEEYVENNNKCPCCQKSILLTIEQICNLYDSINIEIHHSFIDYRPNNPLNLDEILQEYGYLTGQIETLNKLIEKQLNDNEDIDNIDDANIV